MKKVFFFFINLTICMQPNAGSYKVIYGENNRFEPHEIENNKIVHASKSVAAIISNYSLKKIGDKTEIISLNLGDTINYCSSVPYQEQTIAASCSSFLIGPDIILTAGHCIKTEWECNSKSFVFDYRQDLLGKKEGPYKRFRVPNSNIYKCAKILDRKLESDGNLEDWAIIKLDRIVEDREPLTYRKYGKMDTDSKLSLIGFPSGLPLKIAENGTLRSDKNEHYFVAELDAFHMNSGSPVINESTLEVEGVLVRGEKDVVNTLGCYDLVVCKEGTCRGEDVSRITTIPFEKYLR
ncbi:serine protease [Halobacteriovorax sp.]|uniref:trypsin-like serine peptidase n=1 Tax=Halobacteriovorax sp. TaxID=2020862 RepID=UPI003569BE5B